MATILASGEKQRNIFNENGSRSHYAATVLQSSGNLLKSRVDGSCPVCSRNHDTDCRWTQDLGLVLCWTKAKGGTLIVAEPPDDAPSGDDIYRAIGLTADGKWMQYRLMAKQWAKPVREPGKQTFDYYDRVTGQVLCRVTRTDHDDKKDFSQLYRNPDTDQWETYTKRGKSWGISFPKELKDPLKDRLLPYGWQECRDALKSGEPIFVVEGEGKVEALRKQELAAVCFIGGAGKYRYYGYPGYRDLLKGASLVLCPDRDEPGLKHCEVIAEDFPQARWLYVEPDSPEWQNLPKDAGFDIADWLQRGVSKEALLASIGEKRFPTKQSASKVTPIRPGVQLSGESLLERIDGLLELEVTGSSLTAQLSDLAQQSGRQLRDLRELYQQREREQEQEKTREERRSEIERLQKISEVKIDLDYFLDSAIASVLKRKYHLLGVLEAAALATLFPVVGSQCQIGTRLVLSKATDFVVRPIVYSCIVAESGSNKSAAMRTITDPLTRQLQAEAHNKYLKVRNWRLTSQRLRSGRVLTGRVEAQSRNRQ